MHTVRILPVCMHFYLSDNLGQYTLLNACYVNKTEMKLNCKEKTWMCVKNKKKIISIFHIQWNSEKLKSRFFSYLMALTLLH